MGRKENAYKTTPPSAAGTEFSLLLQATQLGIRELVSIQVRNYAFEAHGLEMARRWDRP